MGLEQGLTKRKIIGKLKENNLNRNKRKKCVYPTRTPRNYHIPIH